MKVTDTHPPMRNLLSLSHFLFPVTALFDAATDEGLESEEVEELPSPLPSPSSAAHRSQTISIIEERANAAMKAKRGYTGYTNRSSYRNVIEMRTKQKMRRKIHEFVGVIISIEGYRLNKHLVWPREQYSEP